MSLSFFSIIVILHWVLLYNRASAHWCVWDSAITMLKHGSKIQFTLSHILKQPSVTFALYKTSPLSTLTRRETFLFHNVMILVPESWICHRSASVFVKHTSLICLIFFPKTERITLRQWSSGSWISFSLKHPSKICWWRIEAKTLSILSLLVILSLDTLKLLIK